MTSYHDGTKMEDVGFGVEESGTFMAMVGLANEVVQLLQ